MLSELDCDLHDIKRLIRDSAAEILKEKPDISAVVVSDLDLPCQPDITVTIKEEQDMTADENIGGPSF